MEVVRGRVRGSRWSIVAVVVAAAIVATCGRRLWCLPRLAAAGQLPVRHSPLLARGHCAASAKRERRERRLLASSSLLLERRFHRGKKTDFGCDTLPFSLSLRLTTLSFLTSQHRHLHFLHSQARSGTSPRTRPDPPRQATRDTGETRELPRLQASLPARGRAPSRCPRPPRRRATASRQRPSCPSPAEEREGARRAP